MNNRCNYYQELHTFNGIKGKILSNIEGITLSEAEQFLTLENRQDLKEALNADAPIKTLREKLDSILFFPSGGNQGFVSAKPKLTPHSEPTEVQIEQVLQKKPRPRW